MRPEINLEKGELKLEPPFFDPNVLSRIGLAGIATVPKTWLDDDSHAALLTEAMRDSLRIAIEREERGAQ
jgi:hypothetical protein